MVSQMHEVYVGGRFAKGAHVMTIRSQREVFTFKHPFQIKGVNRLLPAGSYEVDASMPDDR